MCVCYLCVRANGYRHPDPLEKELEVAGNCWVLGDEQVLVHCKSSAHPSLLSSLSRPRLLLSSFVWF